MDMFKLMERAKLLEIEGPGDRRKVTVTMANEKKYQDTLKTVEQRHAAEVIGNEK